MFQKALEDIVARKGRVNLDDLFEAYFDHPLNKYVIERVARRGYLPANQTILEQIDTFKYQPKKFKVSYSLSGVFIEQIERWAPEVLESFRQLASTGMVEFLEQTYFHSLAAVFSDGELWDQIQEHRRLMKDVLGVEPVTIENTEFIYNNHIAWLFDQWGYKAVFTEGTEKILGWRSPNYVYKAKYSNIRVLMRNYRLSDDIGFRFGSRWWSEWPLTADKYAAWLAATGGDVINICIDYETFGEHFPAETGIFEFLRWLPGEVLKYDNLNFALPREVVEWHYPVDEIDVPENMTISWADLERDLTAWLMNVMQWDAFNKIRALEKPLKILGDEKYLRIWRLLMISDHLYYMSTKGAGPGDVHSYFSPYGSALEAYSIFATVFNDFQSRVYRRFEEERNRLKLMWARDLPDDKVFKFYYDWNKPLGWTARNMDEFLWCIEHAPIECIEFHFRKRHFVDWIRFVVGDKELAKMIENIRDISGEKLRQTLADIIRNRRDTIFR